MAKYLALGIDSSVMPWLLDEGSDLDEIRDQIHRAMSGPPGREANQAGWTPCVQVERKLPDSSSVPMRVNFSLVAAASVYEVEDAVPHVSFT